MGIEAIFKCNKCGKKFKACSGGGFSFKQYRCFDCDKIVDVDFLDENLFKDKNAFPCIGDAGVCKKCGGGLRENLSPMCPKCKSRDTEPGQDGMICFYD